MPASRSDRLGGPVRALDADCGGRSMLMFATTPFMARPDGSQARARLEPVNTSKLVDARNRVIYDARGLGRRQRTDNSPQRQAASRAAQLAWRTLWTIRISPTPAYRTTN